MIIGTAGHIDHGKTSLVRALTGVDTDRLPEEKARGISIDLGYAYMSLDDAETVGFIDVPGHERFVHTMLAGATGIDFALLVVAADDGVMPQTQEHLSILSLLGVEHGVVALTKADRVDAERLKEVTRDLRQLLAGTPLAAAAIYPVSTLTGLGLDKLRETFAAYLKVCRQRVTGGCFRLAVDRSFVLGGIGTIVTGTVFSGQVHVGNKLAIAPTNKAVRVRGIHAQNREVETATVGARCALQLAGVSRDEVRRGDWVVNEESYITTDRFDAQLHLLIDEARSLKHWTPVHLHLGAAHVTARVALLEGDELLSGQSALVQLVTSEAIACWHGDRFVLRDQSARRTLGGGRVLDPFGWPRHRRSADRIAMLRTLQLPSAQEKISALVETAPFGLDLARLRQAMNIDLDTLDATIPEVKRVKGSGHDIGFSSARWQVLREVLLTRLAEFHSKFPEELGPDSSRLKRISFPQLHPAAHGSLVDELLGMGKVAKTGPWLHLPEHSAQLSAAEEALAQRLMPLLEDGGFDPPWVRDLAAITGEAESTVRLTLLRLARRGRVFQVVRDLFYAEGVVNQLAKIAAQLHAQLGAVRAADFRDETRLGRKRAIQILEFFDRVGFTRRVSGHHALRGDNLLCLGRQDKPINESLRTT